MRTSRIGILAIVLLSNLTLVGAPAQAGGGDWWEWRAAYAPGDTVTSTVRVWRAASGTGRAGPEEGPYFAYLAPSRASYWEPPDLPDGAMPLGRIRIEDRAENTTSASLAFQVPDVGPGLYTVVHCNRPCTHQLGTLMDTEIRIAADASEARAIRYAYGRDKDLEKWLSHNQSRSTRQQKLVRDVEKDWKGARAELEKDITRLENMIQRMKSEDSSAPLLEGMLSIVIGGGLLFTAMVLVVRRRAVAATTNVQG